MCDVISVSLNAGCVCFDFLRFAPPGDAAALSWPLSASDACSLLCLGVVLGVLARDGAFLLFDARFLLVCFCAPSCDSASDADVIASSADVTLASAAAANFCALASACDASLASEVNVAGDALALLLRSSLAQLLVAAGGFSSA